MGITVRMVRFHLHAVREKLGVISTSQAVHIAAKSNLLE
jgi:DNA-binding CsgD family transcriptional regulator